MPSESTIHFANITELDLAGIFIFRQSKVDPDKIAAVWLE